MGMPSAGPPAAPPATSYVRVLYSCSVYRFFFSIWQHDRAGLDRWNVFQIARYGMKVPFPITGLRPTGTFSSPCIVSTALVDSILEIDQTGEPRLARSGKVVNDGGSY